MYQERHSGLCIKLLPTETDWLKMCSSIDINVERKNFLDCNFHPETSQSGCWASKNELLSVFLYLVDRMFDLPPTDLTKLQNNHTFFL